MVELFTHTHTQSGAKQEHDDETQRDTIIIDHLVFIFD